jgi:hypothetical protein
MRLKPALAALLVMAIPASAQQAYCPYGQTCQNNNQNNNPVPFPVINPLGGLDVLNPNKTQQPAPQPVLRPTTPTPPPVMPPEPAR